MLGRGIADMLGELPSGVHRVGATHVAIARLLGDDRGGGDGCALRVPADDRQLPEGEPGDGEPVAQADAVRARHPRESVAQSGEVGHVQSAGVDPGGATGDHGHPRREPEDHWEQLRTGLPRLLLRVVQAAERAHLARPDAVEVEDDRGGYKRSGQAAAPGLVGAGYESNAETAVEGEQLAGRVRALARRSASGAGLGSLGGRVGSVRDGPGWSRWALRGSRYDSEASR